MSAVLFAPGIVSTGMDELNSVFSPDGNMFLFSMKMPDRGRHTLLFMEQKDGIWTEPEVLPFAGIYEEADPTFSPDGQRVYFISNRPTEDNPLKEDWDIWFVDRTAEGWSVPSQLGGPINTDKHEVYPSLTKSGTLYFSSGRSGGFGMNDIYRSELVDGEYSEPENLGEAVNTQLNEGDVFVAPDESYIVFVSLDRPFAFGRGDLYVSFRNDDGSWTDAKNMGEGINSKATEYCPVVSPDGNFLFFTSYKTTVEPSDFARRSYEGIREEYRRPGSGMGDIYWVDAGVIEKLRSNE
jgi:Tol biopolymer transport system component